MAYASRPSFKILAQGEAKQQMFAAAEKGDCAKALASVKQYAKESRSPGCKWGLVDPGVECWPTWLVEALKSVLPPSLRTRASAVVSA